MTSQCTCRSHKGSHLSLVVELLTGGLASGAMTQKAAAGNWANLVIALDPALLGPAAGFRNRASALLAAVKTAVPIPDGPGVWLPGERGNARAGGSIPPAHPALHATYACHHHSHISLVMHWRPVQHLMSQMKAPYGHPHNTREVHEHSSKSF